MRRSLWLRSFIAVWAVWLGVVLLGPAEMHACPAHGGHASHAPTGADDMAGMAGMAEMAHGGTHSAPAHDANGQCNCVGACSVALAIAPPSSSIALVAVDDANVTAPAIPAHNDAAPKSAPPHSLPFANGPPALA